MWIPLLVRRHLYIETSPSNRKHTTLTVGCVQTIPFGHIKTLYICLYREMSYIFSYKGDGLLILKPNIFVCFSVHVYLCYWANPNVLWLPTDASYQRNRPVGYREINLYLATMKHYEARSMCIIFYMQYTWCIRMPWNLHLKSSKAKHINRIDTCSAVLLCRMLTSNWPICGYYHIKKTKYFASYHWRLC